MKNLLLFIALISASNILQAQSKTDEADMQAFANNYMSAYNQEDVDAMRKMHTEYAVRIDKAGNEMVGGAKIADYFSEQFKDDDATLSLHQFELNWSDRENAWVAGGTFEIYSNTSKFDFEIAEMGEYANVMVQDNGQWKIAKSVLTPFYSLPPASLSEKSH